MWAFRLASAVFVLCGVSGDISPNYFCADLNPQYHINIDQLMGIWFGIEIINHDPNEEYYVRAIPSCPILHISEESRNHLHRDYNYDYNYGQRRDRPRSNNNYYDRGDFQYQPRNPQYQDRGYGGGGDYYRRRPDPSGDFARPYPQEMKHLRILWDENGLETEFRLKYNTSKPGFLISAGPNNGSALEPQFASFAGTVQVLKAVGNHLVLTFCHQMPDRSLFTILLSRENRLDSFDVHGVHSQLNRKGLSTHNIKKVCNAAIMFRTNVAGFVTVLLLYVIST